MTVMNNITTSWFESDLERRERGVESNAGDDNEHGCHTQRSTAGARAAPQ
jgi:hypothetical protein